MISTTASHTFGLRLDSPAEDFVASLTEAAYHVALQHGFTGSFLDLQLDLWSALRGVAASHLNVHHRTLPLAVAR
jgi:hypothetical protein